MSGPIKSSLARRRRSELLAVHPFCCWCGRKLTEATATIEHLVPHAHRGSNRRENLALACAPCNNLRGHAPAEAAPQRIAQRRGELAGRRREQRIVRHFNRGRDLIRKASFSLQLEFGGDGRVVTGERW
jgi:5-methylcytosine-specific restriction endonuclease McrA